MNPEYAIRFYIKTQEPDTKLSLFVDGKPLLYHKGNYIWQGNGGICRIRIEQDKLFQSKWYWISAPFVFLLGAYAGDTVFDGKTPFYAIYEADVLIDKNVEAVVSLLDMNRHDRAKQGLEFKIKADFSRGTEVTIIKDEFTATNKEKTKWFLTHTVLFSLLFAFILYVAVGAGFASLDTGFGITGAAFSWSLATACISGWIFTIYKFYKHASGKY